MRTYRRLPEVIRKRIGGLIGNKEKPEVAKVKEDKEQENLRLSSTMLIVC
jgi:hypothetical protein